MFFFSSRRRHTSFSRDWSSDVCSSDLGKTRRRHARGMQRRVPGNSTDEAPRMRRFFVQHRKPEPERERLMRIGVPKETKPQEGRSEERRVGKESRSRGGLYRNKSEDIA